MMSASRPSNASSYEPLLELATPELYSQVAFRLLELPVNAGERELERRRELMEKAARSGLAVPAGAGRVLPLPQAVDEHALRSAAHALQDAQRRLAHEFLWFWPLLPAQAAADPALRHLAAGDAAAALALWQQAAGEAQAVARHNLALWHHARALQLELDALAGAASAAASGEADEAWRAAGSRWRQVRSDDAFWAQLAARIRKIDDPSLPVEAADRLRASLPEALALVATRLAMRALEAGRHAQARRVLAHLAEAGLDATAVDAALRRTIEPVRSLLASLRKDAGAAPRDDAKADARAERLLGQSEKPLALLDALLPPEHPARQAERDEVADAALVCQIRFFNADGDAHRAQALLERLAPLACGAAVKDRIAGERSKQAWRLQELVCWFCGANDGDEQLAIPVAMHGEVKNEPAPDGTRTTWRHGVFKVPRCRQCVDEGRIVAGSGRLALLVFNAGLAGAAALFLRVDELGGMAAAGVAMLGAIWVAMRERRARLRRCRPDTARRARDAYPDIKERLAAGWAFGDRPVGA